MDSFQFDNVKAEKEDAMWRYNVEKKLRSGLRSLGFLSVLFLVSWSWFPTLISDTVDVAGDIHRRFINPLNEPPFIFIAINIIILVVYILSSQKQSTGSDVYDEYVGSRRSVIPASAVEETTVEKQIIPVENVVAVVTDTKRSVSPLKQQEQQLVKPEITSTDTNTIKQKEYRRTRSVVSESQSRRPRRREFRRSETVMMGRELVVSSSEPPRKSIDEMSNEEFQLIVDSFIAEKRKTLMQENVKEKCMSIVVKN